jgi:hypothetical protein
VRAPCRYRLGKPGAAKVLLLFKQGWAALPQFGMIDRAAILVVSASMVPYSPPIKPHVSTLRSCIKRRHCGVYWGVLTRGQKSSIRAGCYRLMLLFLVSSSGSQQSAICVSAVLVCSQAAKVLTQSGYPVQATPSDQEAEVDLRVHPGIGENGTQQQAEADGHELVRRGRQEESRHSEQRQGQRPAKGHKSGPAEYEFTAWEERVMEVSWLPGPCVLQLCWAGGHCAS